MEEESGLPNLQLIRTNQLIRLVRTNATFRLVVAISVGAFLMRIVGLGTRVAHWDEARVGYDILRYGATGIWEYRPGVHGPFLPQVNVHLFELLGASDFTMRLVVALVGGLLPLSAWLFRERLRETEVVALAVLLAANPILLYYSRFMRNDLLLAAFMLTALGLFVRTADTGRTGYLYAGVAFLVFAFASKENVLVTVLTWIGAGVLLFDHRLFSAHARDETAEDILVEYGKAIRSFVHKWWLPLGIGVVEFFALIVFFYAPRPEFSQALTNPVMLPGVIEEATIGSVEKMSQTWVGGRLDEGNVYKEYFAHFVKTLLYGGLPLVVLSGVGFVVDRYDGAGPRDVVSFCFYWGFVTIFGYPIITDIMAPWGPVHVIVPLALPAAVGLALIYRWGREAFLARDAIGGTLATVLLLGVALQVGMVALDTSYLNQQSQENELAQYGQPAEGIRPTLDRIGVAIAGNEGTDVIYFGEAFYVRDESSADVLPASGNWYNRLPLVWYLERYGATEYSTTDTDEFRQLLTAERPPVVVVRQSDREQIASSLAGYRAYEHELTLWVPEGDMTVIYIDESRVLDEPASGT